MMTDIKRWLFKRRIAREKRKMGDLSHKEPNTLKKIALLFDTTIPGEPAKAKQLINFVETTDKKIRALAYVETIENAIHVSCPIYSYKQINWLNIPNSMDVASFINYEADLLILLNPKRDGHKNYILALSKAKIKAGMANYDEFDKYYNFLIDVENFGKENTNLFVDIFRTVINFK